MSFPSKCSEVALEVSMNCDSCATTVRKWALEFEGVRNAETDLETNTLTVNGTVDPSMIQFFLSENTKKEVDVISWRAKGDPWVVTRVGCLCSDCDGKLTRIVAGNKGIEFFSNTENLTVRVKGEANMKALRQTLRDTLREHDRSIRTKGLTPRRDGGGEKKPTLVQMIIVDNMIVNVNGRQIVPDAGPSIRRW